jgi:hypothetical protein
VSGCLIGADASPDDGFPDLCIRQLGWSLSRGTASSQGDDDRRYPYDRSAYSCLPHHSRSDESPSCKSFQRHHNLDNKRSIMPPCR